MKLRIKTWGKYQRKILKAVWKNVVPNMVAMSVGPHYCHYPRQSFVILVAMHYKGIYSGHRSNRLCHDDVDDAKLPVNVRDNLKIRFSPN